MHQSPAVNLLWTGGWDSTYRLAQLILVEKRPVQPFYLIDPQRKSLAYETNAMDRITVMLQEKSPDTRSLLYPTKICRISEISLNPTLLEKFYNLSGRFHIGRQYLYFSCFAEQFNLQDLELAIEYTSHTERPLWDQFFYYSSEDDGNIMVSRNVEDEDFLLFKNFRFPVFLQTKRQMQVYSMEHGFYDIMLQTWFCHSPKNGRSCGVCGPCTLVLNEGLGFRLPTVGTWKSFMRKMKSAVRKRKYRLYEHFFRLSWVYGKHRRNGRAR